jgi:archaellum biogenesis ATPase FlaH
MVTNESFTRAVIPHIKEKYFGTRVESILFSCVREYFMKYDTVPTKDAVALDIEKRNDISQEEFNQIGEFFDDMFIEQNYNNRWLVDTTEKWCKERAVYLAMMDAISIIEGNDKSHNPDAIPGILTDALSVSFDKNVGHDYVEDFESRYDFYVRKEERIPFDIDYLNKATNGGIPNKTLVAIMSPTGIGKSLVMCNFASHMLSLGKNVLYITMEMAEEKIAERIDANLMDVSVNNLCQLPKQVFASKFREVQKKATGRLIIKQFPTGSAHVGHFRSLLQELQIKKSFVPHVIFVDYLNICCSARVKNSQANSYTIVKSIAEELRGLAIEMSVPVITATQTNRSGFQNSDIDLDNTSESFGLPATVDLMFALISTEELEEQSQIMIKILKNRYGDPNKYKRFVVGIDRSKMRLFDVEQSAMGGSRDESEETESVPSVIKLDRLKGKFNDFSFD